MRVYFAHILESFDSEYPGGQTICYRGHNSPYSSKGETKDLIVSILNDARTEVLETKKVARVLGLGYADFKNEDDYKARAAEVIRKKLAAHLQR